MANYGEIAITAITEKTALPKLNCLKSLNKVSVPITEFATTEFHKIGGRNYLNLLYKQLRQLLSPIRRDNILAVIRYGRGYISLFLMERFHNSINLVNEKKLARWS